MTERGFEMPPDHIVFQMLSIFDLSSPVIMVLDCLPVGWASPDSA